MDGKITDEGVARLRERIGKGFEGRQPWRTEVTRDAIWHLAHAIGDLSPLYTDEAYARRTRWGRRIAPGIIVNTMDTLRAPGSSGLPEGLPSVHSIWSGSRYTWERPLGEGDRIRSRSFLEEVDEKRSEFSDGRTVYQTYTAEYWDQDDRPVGRRSDTYMRVDRAKARRKAKYGGAPRLALWTPEQIEGFQEEYRAHERTVERFWDDVRVGDALRPLLKGPLTATAEIAFESFFGIYLVGNGVASRLLDAHPKLMLPNEQGVPEPPQRVHWDHRFTQQTLGLPGAYDLGLERCAWLCQGVTDWMGDDGELRSIDARYLRFNFLGDVTWVHGRVVEKWVEDGRGLVRLELETKNHLDEVTARATAVAALPRRSA